MASGILAILDDVATLLDDAAVMSKVAAKKTAGLLGDDLAVNAEKAVGFKASRELPVIWAITRGSLVNKLIIVPVALLLSAYAPWLIVPILLLGGAYLSFEGAEKVFEWIFPHKHHESPAAETADSAAELLGIEKRKIKGAIRTDFILSIEIIVITLGTVMEQTLAMRIIVVSAIALLATVGVYGLVALLVRMDDAGIYLIARARQMSGAAAGFVRRCGHALIAALPRVIRLLGVVGTIAMLLVGGGMYVHNIDAIHHALHFLPGFVGELLVGIILGIILVGAMHLLKRFRTAAPESGA
jgi:predicted DNA repair protein MutK